MVTIKENINILDEINEYEVILIGTNVYNTLSGGVQREVSLKYPYVQEKNLSTLYGDVKKMGTILECHEEGNPLIVLLYITKGYGFQTHKEFDYLSYESLEQCLQLVNVLYKGKKIATTFLGATRFDGNGNKDQILEIFNKVLTNVDVTIYDYKQLSAQEVGRIAYEKFLKLSPEERKKAVSEQKKRLNNKPNRYFNGKKTITS